MTCSRNSIIFPKFLTDVHFAELDTMPESRDYERFSETTAYKFGLVHWYCFKVNKRSFPDVVVVVCRCCYCYYYCSATVATTADADCASFVVVAADVTIHDTSHIDCVVVDDDGDHDADDDDDDD